MNKFPLYRSNHKIHRATLMRGSEMMAEMCNVLARVISQRGTCVAGHKVGDEFLIGDTTPHGMCSWAFYTAFPFASTLQYQGFFPWESVKEKAYVACPDPNNPVLFELTRIRK